MNKQEYLNRLEKLLSDISEEERFDALTFYQNYFEDAGPENEERVIKELGSPEKVASSIKRDLTQLNEENRGTASTQNSPRFEGPDYSSYQDDKTSDSYSGSYNAYSTSTGSSTKEGFFARMKRELNEWTFYREHKTLCSVLFIFILLISSPAWGGLLAGALGILFGVLGVILSIVVACFALAITGIIVGVSLIIVGISCLAASLGSGLFIMGIGAFFLAFGALFTVATSELCFRFIPWSYRSIRNLVTDSSQPAGGATA